MTELAQETPTPKVFVVQIKGGVTKEVDSARIASDEMYEQIFALGLKTMLESVGMSKLTAGVTKLEGKELTQRQEEISARADETIEQIYSGSLKSRAKAKKAPSKVETEALRLAKNMAKDIIRANGQKQNAYSAKELTQFAKVILDRNRASLIATAEKNLEEREVGAKALSIPGLEEIFGAKANDPETKAKPRHVIKRKETEVGKPISAAQASMVAPRQSKQKPIGSSTFAH